MTTQNYLIVENNIVTNSVVWDGDINTWTPPVDSIALAEATTRTMVWQPVVEDGKTTDWVLTEQLGGGAIGFTWDGEVLTTNISEPKI